MLVLSIKTDRANFEVHMLNPKEHFPNFGGSKHALVVGKTASMVIRSEYIESGQLVDDECDINDPVIWAWIADLINNNDSISAKAHGLPSDFGEAHSCECCDGPMV
jgi:hypothetical protein